ncbi:hypothetical protein SUGI_0675180 [Cryptomeria japonica]|nr:hypothetical protein SUGI_0675180 [Cryptomeria japonica]
MAILILKQPLHVDKNGEACHGVDDTSNEMRSQFAPNLFDEYKAYIERLFLMDPQGADKPFIMGIQTSWMLDMMVRFSHNSIISMDSTFATKKYVYQLYLCLIFDEQQLGVPVAWVVTLRNKIKDI